jgi:hypothetical protein
VLILAGVAFGMRAPLGGVLVSLWFIGVVAISLSAISYTVGLLTKSEDVLAPAINMVVVPLMLLSGIMLPMTLGPGWLQAISRATPFRYIIDAMRGAFAGHYLTTIMLEGVLVPVDRRPRLRPRERLAAPRALPRGNGRVCQHDRHTVPAGRLGRRAHPARGLCTRRPGRGPGGLQRHADPGRRAGDRG